MTTSEDLKLTTKIGLDRATVAAAVRQWIASRPDFRWVVDTVLDREEQALLAVNVHCSLDQVLVSVAIREYVARETGLSPVRIEWLVASATGFKQCDGCLVEVETPRAPPRDILPLPPRSFPGVEAQRRIDAARSAVGRACESASGDQPVEELQQQ